MHSMYRSQLPETGLRSLLSLQDPTLCLTDCCWYWFCWYWFCWYWFCWFWFCWFWFRWFWFLGAANELCCCRWNPEFPKELCPDWYWFPNCAYAVKKMKKYCINISTSYCRRYSYYYKTLYETGNFSVQNFLKPIIFFLSIIVTTTYLKTWKRKARSKVAAIWKNWCRITAGVLRWWTVNLPEWKKGVNYIIYLSSTSTCYLWTNLKRSLYCTDFDFKANGMYLIFVNKNMKKHTR